MESHFEKLQTLDGKAWSAEQFADKITVVSFADQKSQDLAAKAASGLGKLFMDHPKFQVVTAVKVPSMFKGLAGQLLKAGQVKARESAVKKFEKEGKTAPEGLAERIHVVFDLDGKCGKEALSGWESKEARLLIVDGSGASQGQSSDPDPETAVNGIKDKVAELLG